MARSFCLVLTTCALLTFSATSSLQAAKPKGLGDPGKLTTLQVAPNPESKGFTLRSRDQRQQLYVTGLYSSEQTRDFTRNVTYKVEPEGIVKVTESGFVTPITDGQVTITVTTAEGQSAVVSATVSGIAADPSINFKNQIVPIFTKLGCNSGGCHGKASGQNGFKLSLLGFYPNDDYEFLVKEGRGRRLLPASPDESLMLTKAIGKSPHGGGKRMNVDSYEYRLLAHWVEQGMPYGKPEDPVVTGIRCLPESRVMDRSHDQQITVMATYSDGSSEDVTQMALFEANDT